MKKLIFIIMILMISFDAFSQSKKTPPLVYKISFVSIDKTTKELKVTLKIINTGMPSIVIDVNKILYSTTFVKVGKKLPNGGRSNSIGRVNILESAQPYKGNYVLLRNKEPFEITHDFILTDSFFENNQKYVFSASYGQTFDIKFGKRQVWKGNLESNKIEFSL
jgi:hypothetical protein